MLFKVLVLIRRGLGSLSMLEADNAREVHGDQQSQARLPAKKCKKSLSGLFLLQFQRLDFAVTKA